MRAAAKRRPSEGFRALCRSDAVAGSPSPSTRQPDRGAGDGVPPEWDDQVLLLHTLPAFKHTLSAGPCPTMTRFTPRLACVFRSPVRP